MRVRVLGSGSKGNCIAVSSKGKTLLVDLGFSCKEVCRRLKSAEIDVASVVGVIFTHDHTDHCASARVFHNKFADIPFYANYGTSSAISHCCDVPEDAWWEFATNDSFDVGPFRVSSFATSHDATDPVCFLIGDGEAKVFVGTDTGRVTTGFSYAFSQANLAVLESNHDPILLQTSDRDPALKRRIAGPSGHLCNDDAAQLMRDVNPPQLRTILLAHLSQECNSVSLARSTMKAALDGLSRGDVRLEVLSQDEPSASFEV